MKEAFEKSTPNIQKSILKQLGLDTIEEMELRDLDIYGFGDAPEFPDPEVVNNFFGPESGVNLLTARRGY